MQGTPRIKVWSDRIPRVLLFIYFCRGLSGNMEERPTRRVYIEILMCAPIFCQLEESRSHTNEREAEQAQPQCAHLARRAPALLCWSISTSLVDYAPPHLRIKENRSIKVGLIRRLLGILNANRKIRKRTDTDVAFTREYSRVSIFHRERECTN